MVNYIDKNKIEYVWFHLTLRCDFVLKLKKYVKFQNSIEGIYSENMIVFPLSDKSYSDNYVIDDIPVFYPIKKNNKHFYIDNKNNLVFSHDICKQIFCLMTLCLDKNSQQKDKLGRIDDKKTINYKLNIVNIPIVDILYQVIIDAFKVFCIHNKIVFIDSTVLKNSTFFVSHDVDRISSRNFWYSLNYLKQKILHGENKYSFYDIFFGKQDDLDDFSEIFELEKDIKSTFFILSKGELHKDAYYSLRNKKICRLINNIKNNNDEIAMHTTIKGNTDSKIFTKNLKKLNKRIPEDNIVGVRSHWLRFDIDKTPDILEASGIKYDSSVAFYSLTGFRSGTSIPYRLFNFKKNKISSVWEIPLIFMDCQILDYSPLPFYEAIDYLNNLIDYIIKFNGIFTILWHNGNFAQKKPFDRKKFYIELLNICKKRFHNSKNGVQIINELNHTRTQDVRNFWNF